MKTKTRKLLAVVAAFLVSAILGMMHAGEASAALPKAVWPMTTAIRCWSIESGMFIKARIAPQSSGFFTLSFIVVSKGAIHNVGTGTAYLRGDLVYLMLGDVGNDSNAMWTSQSYKVINRYTLTGQEESIGHDKNYADSSLDTEYTSSLSTLPPFLVIRYGNSDGSVANIHKVQSRTYLRAQLSS